MYRSNYSLLKKWKRTWRTLAFLLTFAVALLVAGLVNDWWLIFSGNASPQTESNSIAIVETVSIFSLDASQPTYEPPPTSVPVKNAADFVLPDLFDETVIHRRSDYNGHPLILNFWASWCAPCREEMPALQRVYETNKDNGLIVLGINETYIDDVEAARDFVNELGLTFPNGRDDSGDVSSDLYWVIGLPTSVFISAEGEIVHVQVGQMSNEQIEMFSRRLITGESIAE